MDLSLKEIIAVDAHGMNCFEFATRSGRIGRVFYQGDLKDVAERLFREAIEFNRGARLRSSDAIKKLNSRRMEMENV